MTIEDYLKTLISFQLTLIQIKNEREECYQSSKVCANGYVNSFVNIDGSSIHEANNIMSTMDSMDQSSTISLHTIESISSPISPGNSLEKCDAIYIKLFIRGENWLLKNINRLNLFKIFDFYLQWPNLSGGNASWLWQRNFKNNKFQITRTRNKDKCKTWRGKGC